MLRGYGGEERGGMERTWGGEKRGEREGEEEYLMKDQEGANRRLSPQGGGNVAPALCLRSTCPRGSFSAVA